MSTAWSFDSAMIRLLSRHGAFSSLRRVSLLYARPNALRDPLSDTQPRGPKPAARNAKAGRALAGLLLAAGLMLCSACGMSQGSLLYLLGVGRAPLIKAEFRLTDQPVLILIDDAANRVDWPPARRRLFEELSQLLIKEKGAKRIIPLKTIDALRRTEPNFEKRGCREVGKMADADQVLWIEVRDFLAEEQVTDIESAAYFAVSVRVIDVTEERRSRVRVWPTSPDGRLVSVSMTASEASIAKTKSAIARELARRLAIQVTNVFCDHRAPDFERKQ